MSPASYVVPLVQARELATSPASTPTHSTVKECNALSGLPQFTLSPPAFLELVKSNSLEDEREKHTEALNNLLSRVDRLHRFGSGLQDTNTETLQACMASLRTRMPLVLRQTEEWVERGTSPQAHLVCKLRSTLALFRADQYLDRIQEAIDPTSNGGFDEQLRTVLAGLNTACLSSDLKKGLAFRISPWVPSTLCFDLPIGDSARAAFPGHGTKLPICLDVEPVVEFRADDHASLRSARAAAHACHITILECRHVARKFDTRAAGVMGEATVRILVAPLDASALGANDSKQVWGCESIVKSLHVQEARACQLNAFPPQPKANVDLYTSHAYGDAAVTVTLVIKTCVTKSTEEAPDLHIELFMAPPKAM